MLIIAFFSSPLPPLLAAEIYCVIENDGGKEKKERLMKNFLLLLLRVREGTQEICIPFWLKTPSPDPRNYFSPPPLYVLRA